VLLIQGLKLSEACCEVPIANPNLKKVLWIALFLNALMFFVELAYGWYAESASLKADAVDFLGDSINYGLSLFVLGSALKIRARASIFKALTMAIFGVGIIVNSTINFFVGSSPHATTISTIGLIALIVNVGVALLLYRFRKGDSNIKSVWLCSRNDAIGNIAVIAAGFGVLYFNSNLPDLIVAVLMSTLNLTAATRILHLAYAEIHLHKN